MHAYIIAQEIFYIWYLFKVNKGYDLQLDALRYTGKWQTDTFIHDLLILWGTQGRNLWNPWWLYFWEVPDPLDKISRNVQCKAVLVVNIISHLNNLEKFIYAFLPMQREYPPSSAAEPAADFEE